MIKKVVKTIKNKNKQLSSNVDFLSKAAFILLCFIFFFLIPSTINSAMVHWNIPTGSTLNSSHWLGFWGGYIGSVFGVMASLFAFLFTYRQNEQQHRQTREEIQRRQCLENMPIFDVLTYEHFPASTDLNIKLRLTPTGFTEVYNSNLPNCIICRIQLINVGRGTALNALLIANSVAVRIGHLAQHRSVNISFHLPDLQSDIAQSLPPIRISSYDIEERIYRQIITIELQNNSYRALISHPQNVTPSDKTAP